MPTYQPDHIGRARAERSSFVRHLDTAEREQDRDRAHSDRRRALNAALTSRVTRSRDED